MALATLKRRSEFQRVRGGRRWACAAFLIEAKARTGDGTITGPRFGFTVTRKLGSAVVRNRIRRRLREALRLLVRDVALGDVDCIVVAREAAGTLPFADLVALMSTGLGKVRASGERRPRSARG